MIALFKKAASLFRTAPALEKRVVESLRAIRLPDSGANLMESGLIAGLSIEDGHVSLVIEIAPHQAQRMEEVRKKAEQAIASLAGVTKVTAVLTAQKPPAPTSTPPAAQAPQMAGRHRPAPSSEKLLPGVRHVIAVASGKGGVGKSTTAVNLAFALSRLGLSVGLFDADIYGPSLPRMLGIPTAKPEAAGDKKMAPLSVHGLKAMSIGFMVAEENPLVWRGPMVMGALEQLLRDVEWGTLDVMVVDMPPGTGDTQLTMTQRLKLSGAVIVSTPQDIALLDARKGLAMFRKVDVPVLGIIENMSFYICPKCGHEDDIFGHGGAKAEAEKLGCPFLGEIPLDRTIRETSDEGRPIVLSAPESPHALAYRKIAAMIWEKL